jgi:hypothetical protein
MFDLLQCARRPVAVLKIDCHRFRGSESVQPIIGLQYAIRPASVDDMVVFASNYWARYNRSLANLRAKIGPLE